LKKRKMNFTQLEEGTFDRLLGSQSGAGILFGSTGGVMEAALRTAYETLTGTSMPKLEFETVRGLEGIRQASIEISPAAGTAQKQTIRVAVAHEIRNAKAILESLRKGNCTYDFVEVMACPGGCLGGGGQPHPTNAAVRAKRQKAIYERDAALPIRKSHENPNIRTIYKEFLSKPGSDLAHQLLHTTYLDRLSGSKPSSSRISAMSDK